MAVEELLFVSGYVLVVSTITALAMLLLISIKWQAQQGSEVVTIVVLGDIGRSPRMQYHAMSLVKTGYQVDFVGFGGSTPLKTLVESSQVRFLHISTTPSFVQNIPISTVRYFGKTVFQMFALFWIILCKTRKSRTCLVQTPPAIPTLAVVWACCLMRGTKFIIDWHNYGYTIMALTLGKNHFLVKISEWYEWFFGNKAGTSLCVTDAMKKDLQIKWGIKSVLLYDRPPDMFKPIPVKRQHELFMKLKNEYSCFDLTEASDAERVASTIFTDKDMVTSAVSFRKDRPFLIVSSTSWTEDEDFSVLLSALEIYETSAVLKGSGLPNILCIITGKGPLKTHYEKEIRKKGLNRVKICTMWLEAEDYPVILGCADLGVSLHKSSSGLDLPMKVVDMFGCGLPVCAIEFNCIQELVQHKSNGLIFNSPESLAKQIKMLSKGFPETNGMLKQFRENLISFQSLRWHHYWKLHVRPIL